jgi:hypothetical protein
MRRPNALPFAAGIREAAPERKKRNERIDTRAF